MNELREYRKAHGLCVQCGAKLDRKGICCIRCNDINNASKRRRRLKISAKGKCANCEKPLDREGIFCTECTKKLKLMARKRDAERRANGLCIQCGSKTNLGSYCERCLNMRMDRYWLKNNLELSRK